jgi:hypothetical protein
VRVPACSYECESTCRSCQALLTSFVSDLTQWASVASLKRRILALEAEKRGDGSGATSLLDEQQERFQQHSDLETINDDSLSFPPDPFLVQTGTAIDSSVHTISPTYSSANSGAHWSNGSLDQTGVILGTPLVSAGGRPSRTRLPLDYDFSGEISGVAQVDEPEEHGTETHSGNLEHSILPPLLVIHQLFDHFCAITNASYPIFHVPSLRNQFDEMCGTNTASSGDVCIVLSESPII